MTRLSHGRQIRRSGGKQAGGRLDIFCETPAWAFGHGAGCFGVGACPRPPWRGGRGVSVETTSCWETARAQGHLAGPGLRRLCGCVEAYYGSRRGAVVRARDVSLETETSSKTQSRWRSVPSAGRRSRVPRRRLRRRGEPFGTSALARRGRSAVRGRVGQSPSIHLEPARCRRRPRPDFN